MPPMSLFSTESLFPSGLPGGKLGEQMKTFSRIIIGATLVASLLVGASPAHATCPKDLAGKLVKEQAPAMTLYNFNWPEMFTETAIGDDDELVLDLSVIPW